MLIKHGIPASPGIAIGPAFVLGAEDFRIPKGYVAVDAVDSEIARFRTALSKVSEEISANEALAAEHLGKEYAAIFSAHLMLLQDPKLAGEIESRIRDSHQSPEYAATQVLRRYASNLATLGNQYLAERATDIFDLERSLLRHLLGEQREELAHLTQSVIVLAHNLTPSETAGLNRQFVQSFVTEVGGSTSHTAILAGALEIPAVVGVRHLLTEVSGGEMVIVDGEEGRVIIDPDESTLATYQARQVRHRAQREKYQAKGAEPAITSDGTLISVYGNIEFPEEAEQCRLRGADGIGLYRTEFLYLGAAQGRTEEDHFNAYRKVIETFPDQPVIIRTLDVGADKIPGGLRGAFNEQSNRELGLRSVRVSLEFIDLFKTQLRAILRAATFGNVQVMFPLISAIGEFRQAKMVLRDVREDLEYQKIPFRGDIPVGMMVEVPSAALMATEFAREVDFFSIGTNDLIQYTLAADRADPSVSKYYNPTDPAVLMLIQRVIDAANQAKIPVTICGQMSSNPMFIPLLLGMGLRQISVTPQSIPALKDTIRRISIPEAERLLKRAKELDIARDIEALLREDIKGLMPPNG